jgi:peptide/nickel transport system substrate-binding protein
MQRVGPHLLCASFTICTLLLLCSIFLSSLPAPISPNSNNIVYAQTEKKGAYADEVTFIHYLDENVALQDLKDGKIDTYFSNIPLEVVSDTKNDPNLNVYETTGGTEGLLLNPAPAKSTDSGGFNPFSIRQVRFAMNYLLDRDFIVNEILKGYGSSMYDPFGIYSPEYLNIIDTVQSFGFRHNSELAQKLISDALTQAGATKDVSSGGNGKWTYKGKPITIKILIRGDISTRKSIGELVASNLESLGFNVVRDYGDLNKANSIIYGSDPQDLKWNVYEEQFASSGFAKYEPGLVGQMYAPWNANMPGTQNPSFWNYKNATLDKITQKIIFGNYTSKNERNDLLRSAVRNGIQESVRVFIAKDINPYVATKNFKGLINDFGAGITSRFSLINARFEDNRTNNIKVGMKQIYVGAWNGPAGFKDAYGIQISSTISDPGVFADPYTGETIPVRTPWIDIQTKGPLGKMAVSPDAIIWDPVNQNWKKVGENNNKNNNNATTTSISKVTYDLKYSKWHNGIMMDKNDLLYSAYFGHEWGTNTGQSDKTVDSEVTSQAAQSIKYDKGLRFLSNSKVESYIDFWHFDNKEIAGNADIWAGSPWEIGAASERLVTSGKFAFSKTDSTSKGVDWLSLIIPSHANAIKEELQKMKAEGYVPIALRDTVNVDEAKKRYDATINWITRHNNAIIGNGPFYLDNYNPAGGTITIKAYRDNSYPFGAGYWNNKYQRPKLATIENVNDIPRFIRIGQPVNIGIQVNVDGRPSDNAILNYYISNSSGSVVLSGVVAKPPSIPAHSTSNPTTSTNAGRFTINLSSIDTAKLPTGPIILKVFANSLEAYKPYILTKTIIALKTHMATSG